MTITDLSDYAVEGYVVVDKSKLNKKQVASFIKLINEAIDDNCLFKS